MARSLEIMTALSILITQHLNKAEGNESFQHDEDRSAAIRLASEIFFKEIHPYFTDMFGDYWLSKFAGGNLKCDFSKTWIHSISGLSRDDIARAIAHHALYDNAQYPPTPLRLRQMAVTTRDNYKAVNLEILNANMTRV